MKERNKLEDTEHQREEKKTPGKLNLMTEGKRKPETYKFPQEGKDL